MPGFLFFVYYPSVAGALGDVVGLSDFKFFNGGFVYEFVYARFEVGTVYLLTFYF